MSLCWNPAFLPVIRPVLSGNKRIPEMPVRWAGTGMRGSTDEPVPKHVNYDWDGRRLLYTASLLPRLSSGTFLYVLSMRYRRKYWFVFYQRTRLIHIFRWHARYSILKVVSVSIFTWSAFARRECNKIVNFIIHYQSWWKFVLQNLQFFVFM